MLINCKTYILLHKAKLSELNITFSLKKNKEERKQLDPPFLF